MADVAEIRLRTVGECQGCSKLIDIQYGVNSDTYWWCKVLNTQIHNITSCKNQKPKKY